MWRRLLASGLVLLVGGLGTVPAVGQMGSSWGFGRRGGHGELTPEQQQEMYDHVAEHQLERFSEDYELTAEQQEMVRNRLEELKAQQRAYAEPLREEFQSLQHEMHESFRLRHEGQEIDEARSDEVRERLRAIWSDSPMMNPERSAQAIESLLPAEQVAKGQKRRAERWAEWEQRRGSRQERQGEGRRGGRERGGRDGDFSSRRGDPWDRYVEEFTQRYQLDPAQRESAQSMLREFKQERDMHREVHREEWDALREIEDRQARRDAYGKLNEPIDQLFDQLKDRLTRIPTSAQIRVAEASAPTSQPAAATSQPSGPSSRSFGGRTGRGRSSRRDN